MTTIFFYVDYWNTGTVQWYKTFGLCDRNLFFLCGISILIHTLQPVGVEDSPRPWDSDLQCPHSHLFSNFSGKRAAWSAARVLLPNVFSVVVLATSDEQIGKMQPCWFSKLASFVAFSWASLRSGFSVTTCHIMSQWYNWLQGLFRDSSQGFPAVRFNDH